MPKGLTRNSSPIQVSARISESAANTYTTSEIELTLNALDQEVFVVTQVNIDPSAPSIPIVNGVNSVSVALSSTNRTLLGTIADANVIATARREIGALVFTTSAGPPPELNGALYSYDREDPLFAAQSEDYIGIVATSSMFLGILGENNNGPMGADVRVYGYRAKMDAAGYAALVQSQVLSS